MLNEYQSQGHSLTLVKGHSDFKVKTCFLINSWLIWNQNSYESFRENRYENLYKWVESHNQHGPMPIYGKNLKKSPTPEPIGQWPWNLVCSIMYGSSTKVVQIMTLGWPWPILRQGQIWSHRLLYEKKVKIIYFLETIAALGHKVAWSI